MGNLHCGTTICVLADDFGGIKSLAHRRITGGVQLGIKTQLRTASQRCDEIVQSPVELTAEVWIVAGVIAFVRI